MPVEKTVEELFDEYVAMENNTYHYTDIDSKNRQQQIISEVKQQVRREQLQDIFEFAKIAESPIYATRSRTMIKEYALSKGITLKN